MSILSAEQFKYIGKGPLDAKSLVDYYADLLSADKWTEEGKLVAYNGMIVSVWRDTDTNNGIYFLHDKTVTKPIHKPNVADPANWHKLGGINDLPGLTEQITTIQTELNSIKSTVQNLQNTATEVVEQFSDLPTEGITGKLYVVTKDTATYVWYNGAYLLVGDDQPEIQIIMGGGPNN